MSTTDATPLTRTVDGTEVPAAGTYQLDASHSHVGFSVRHVMVSKTKGRFAEVEGTVVIADDPLQSSVEVEIAAASIDTRDHGRDEHLRSADFLDVELVEVCGFDLAEEDVLDLTGSKQGLGGHSLVFVLGGN